MTPYCECSASESFGRKSTEGYIIFYLQFILLFYETDFSLFSTVFYLSNFPLGFLFYILILLFLYVLLFRSLYLMLRSLDNIMQGLSVSMLGEIIFLFQTHFWSKTFLFPLFFCHLLQMLFYAGSLCI